MEADKTALVSFILSMITVVIVIGVGALVLVEFNASADSDNNASSQEAANTVFGNSLDMVTNFTGQLDTIGTIGAILLLVVMVSIAGMGAYMYGRNKGMF